MKNPSRPVMRNHVIRAIFIIVILIVTIPVRANEGFSAGAARCEITPDLKLTNWITHKPYGEALEPIFARAVVLDQNGKRVVCVSWELLYAMEGAVTKVRTRIAKETGIVESNIMICATHNHSAPWSPILGDPITKGEHEVLQSFLADPLYPAWAEKLFDASVRAVKEADAARRPATLAIGRAYIGDVIFNRRPVKPDGTVESMAVPGDPYVLPHGLRFEPTDPTMTVLVLRDDQKHTIATLFNLPCHAVMMYPTYNGISADWPGAVSTALQDKLGGEGIFLQGCAGNVVPGRRGAAARDQMAAIVSDRAVKAANLAQALVMTNDFKTGNARLQLPANDVVKADLKRDQLPGEVQVISCGSLALVALPGEPLIGLAMAIQERSPFPNTVVIGYANGYGAQYVGMPGDKRRGGYEMARRGLGTDDCGQMLIDSALRLLAEQKRP
jgi:neutral ceramidase